MIVRVLQKEFVKFKIKQRNDDVEEALLKNSTFFSFYNITNKYCLVPIEELLEKLRICESSMTSKAKFYSMEIVVVIFN